MWAENRLPLFLIPLSTMIASRGIAHSVYVFVLSHDLIQKLCNFLDKIML